MTSFHLLPPSCNNGAVSPSVAPVPLPLPAVIVFKESIDTTYQTVRPYPLHPQTHLHPLHLPAQPVRFRANLEGLKFQAQELPTL